MLISTKHRFVFVCVPKCASTAIEAALRKHASISLGGVPQIKHTTVAEYREYLLPYLEKRLGHSVHEYACLALFREPIEWLSSWYSYRARPELSSPDHPAHRQYTGDISFGEFISGHCRRKREAFAQVKRQYTYVVDEADSLEHVELFRYDRMDRFLETISKRVGQEIKLQPKNVSAKREIELTQEHRALAEDYLAREYAIYNAIR